MAEDSAIRAGICALVLVLSLATVYDQYRAQIRYSPGALAGLQDRRDALPNYLLRSNRH